MSRLAGASIWAYLCLPCVWAGACAGDTSNDSPSAHEQVTRAAAAALPCDEDSIWVDELGSEEYLAIGCGRLMRFDCSTRARCCPFVEPGLNLAAPAPPEAMMMTDATGRTKEAIRAVIAAEIDAIRACYQAHLDSAAWSPDTWPQGKIVVSFVIAADGSVAEAEIARTSYGDPGVEGCVLDTVRRLRFGPVVDAGIVRMTYPFVLLSEGEPPTSCRGTPAVVPAPPDIGNPN